MNNTKAAGRYAIDLLIKEAWTCYEEDRYADGLAAAERAVEGARQLGDLTLQVRATQLEGHCLTMLGDDAAALVRYTWLLGIGQDSRRREELRSLDITEIVTNVYMDWVRAARALPEIPASKLFEVLDAGEAWLRAVGHADWRAGLLLERAHVFTILRRYEEAIASLQEAIALERRAPLAVGFTRSSYFALLGDNLLNVDRIEEAQAAFDQAYGEATGPYDRKVALQGLADCALDRGDVTLALRHAEAAVQLAESIGDDALGTALGVLVGVHLEANDTAAASAAVERLLACERRVAGSGLYYALRAATDVALDRGDSASARRYLEEAAPFAQAFDRQRGGTAFESEMNKRRLRLEALDSSS